MTRHDKHELPIWLENELQEYDQMIGILSAAKNSAFSLNSSPVSVFVQLLVDLLMRIKNSYEHNVADFENLNPAIIFDDDDVMGPLGNSSQRTIKFKRYLNWGPRDRIPEETPMLEFLRASAVFFSRSLNPDFNFQKAFHELLKNLTQFLPPGIASQKSYKAEKRNKQTKTVQAKARQAYFRRRQNK